MKKKSTGNFRKFEKKKSNAAIKEQFKQEKRKWKKEREDFFEKKKAEGRGQKAETSPKHEREISNEQMPLNKFIAHCGVSSRRDAAEMVKLGKVKVNNEIITETGHKVSAKDEIIVNGKKVFFTSFSISLKTISPPLMIHKREKPFWILSK